VSKRLYNSARWRNARLRHLARSPLCVPCRAAGRTAVATLVHHTVRHQGDPGVFWAEELWESRCTTCHADAQVYEARGGVGREAYRGAGLDGEPMDPGHHWRREAGAGAIFDPGAPPRSRPTFGRTAARVTRGGS